MGEARTAAPAAQSDAAKSVRAHIQLSCKLSVRRYLVEKRAQQPSHSGGEKCNGKQN